MLKILLLAWLSFLTIFCTSVNAQHCVGINDPCFYTTSAYLEADADVESPGGPFFWGQTSEVWVRKGSSENRGFFRFKTPKTTGSVSNARLWLYGGTGAVIGTSSVGIQASSSNFWEEPSITWSTQPGTWSGSWGTYLDTITYLGAGENYYSWDVNPLVSWFAALSGGSFGTVISLAAIATDSHNNPVKFRSKESNVPNYVPALEMTVSATPKQFYDAQCRTCHGDGWGSTSSSAWKQGNKSICITFNQNTASLGPTTQQWLGLFVPGMVQIESARGRSEDGISKGGTSGCLPAFNNCSSMVQPIRRLDFLTMFCVVGALNFNDRIGLGHTRYG